MKKIILGLLLLSFATTPFLVRAQAAQINTPTVAELQAMIASLQAQLSNIIARMQAMQATTVVVPPTTTTNCPVFSRDLRMGNVGQDVSDLQQILINKGYLQADGPTTYFGSMTKDALLKWQSMNGLRQDGIFDPLNRAAMNAQCAPVAPPIVSQGIPQVTPGTISYKLLAGKAGGQPELQLTSNFSVKALNGPVCVYNINTYLKNSLGRKLPDNYVSSFTSTTPVNGISENSLYCLSEGVSAQFTKQTTYKTSEMFTGLYWGVADAITYGPDLNSLTVVNFTELKTNRFAITGERAQYLASVEKVSASSDVYLIKGERLDLVRKVNIFGLSGVQLTIVSKTPGELKFRGNIPAGSWSVNTESVLGNSNSVTLQVGNSNVTNVITAPSGTVRTNSVENILWNPSNFSGNSVKIELGYIQTDGTYSGGQNILDFIDENATNNGLYRWTIPEYYATGVNSNSFYIKITDASGRSVTSSLFSIVPGLAKGSIDVNRPTANGSYSVGQKMLVSWSPYSISDSYSFVLLKGSDRSFSRIIFPTATITGGNYITIPSVVSGSDYYLKVTLGSNRDRTGYSANFSISNYTPSIPTNTPTPTISSISPSTATAGSRVTVMGSNFGTRPVVMFGTRTLAIEAVTGEGQMLHFRIPTDMTPGRYDVSVKNGTTRSDSVSFTVVQANSTPVPTPVSNLPINTPALPSDDDDDEVETPVSATKTLSITYPNGGETFTAGQLVNLRWQSANMPKVIITWTKLNAQGGIARTGWVSRADLSTAAGHEITNTGNFNWDVPSNLEAGQYIVQIFAFDAANPGAGGTYASEPVVNSRTFNIVARPDVLNSADKARLNQMANLLQSLKNIIGLKKDGSVLGIATTTTNSYSAPVISYNAGYPSHRLYLNFPNSKGAGKVTGLNKVSGMDNCFDFSITMANTCSPKEYSSGSSCGIYLQRNPASTKRCVVELSYMDGVNKKTKYFEQFFNTNSSPKPDDIREISSPISGYPAIQYWSSNVSSSVLSGSNNDTGSFKIVLQVAAKNGPVYISPSVFPYDGFSTAENKSIVLFEKAGRSSSTDPVTLVATGTTAALYPNGNVTKTYYSNYKIEDGGFASFIFTGNFTRSQANSDGFYRMGLKQISWGDRELSGGKLEKTLILDPQFYKTNFIYLD